MAHHSSDHHSSKQQKLQIVIIPEGIGEKGFSFTAIRWQLIAGAVGVCLLFAVAGVSAIVFTPLGRLIPVSDAELAHRYGSELVSLQQRVVKLSEEMLVLREYNRKLRVTLGDNTDTDSLMGALSERLAEAPDQPTDGGETVHDSRSGQTETGRASKRSTAAQTHAPATQRESDAAGESMQDGQTQPSGLQKDFRAAFPISAPVEGYITRTFENDKMHFGVDYAGKRGTLITAAADGYVIFSNWTQDGGNIIILSHGGGYSTVYQHNQMLLKQQGDYVKRGTAIALLGDSGTTSYGPHLHFEIWKDGRPQDPGEYLIASEK